MTNSEMAKDIANDEVGKSINVVYRQVYFYSNLTNVAMKMAQRKDEQFDYERKEMLGLVKMIPVTESNQTIIEDLTNMLQ